MVSRDREWDWIDDTDYGDDWVDDTPKIPKTGTTVED